MAFKAAFDLDQAVDNAMASVVYHIRLNADLHENALAERMHRMRVARRNRHLLLLRELRGITFPTTSINFTQG